MKRLAFLAAAALVVAACQDSSVPTAGPDAGAAPVLSLAPQQGPLADRYIVVFKPSVADVDGEIDRAARGFGAQVHYRYYRALKGFAATLPAPALEGLSRNPNVEFIEADGIMSIDATQSAATWGLDRIDQRALPLNNSYTYTATGAGVTAYIIDTGIRLTHNEFGGRATSGFDAVDGGTADDCNGHGTHVAGTVGGSTYGVAKSVSLVAVRVLNCSGSGTYSGVIAGMDWVTAYATTPAVANMSLGGSKSSSINLALANSVAAGVVYAVAAGNENTDACRRSPASAPEAITVGATTSTDSRASYSNYGSCLDLFAPGSSITSAWYSSNTATNTISGTSMATPHVAGVAALYLEANSGADPAQVTQAILATATAGVVGNPGRNSPNLLLYSLFGSGGPTDPPPGETVAVHVSALDGAGIVVNKKFWKASVTVTVVDASGNAVSGATVSASFAPGGSGSCTTSGGSCTIQSGNLSLASVLTTTFTVDGIAGTGLSYDSTKNVLSSTDVHQP